MTGVGIEHAIVASDHAHHYTSPERWLLVGGVVLALAAMLSIEVASSSGTQNYARTEIFVSRFIAMALALTIGAIYAFGAPATVLLLAALCAALVVSDLVIAALPQD
jgi:hypothetical protein